MIHTLNPTERCTANSLDKDLQRPFEIKSD